MTLKRKQHYNNIKEFCNLLNNPDNIILFVHSHNVNQFFINNFFYSFIKEKEIKFFFMKLSIIRKIINNTVISSLLQGPTYVIVTPTLKILQFFLKNFYLKKNIIPLAFFINKNIYNYNYISNLIKKKSIIKLKKNNILYKVLTLYLKIFILFIKNLNNVYINNKKKKNNIIYSLIKN